MGEASGAICGACGGAVQLVDRACGRCGHVFGQSLASMMAAEPAAPARPVPARVKRSVAPPADDPAPRRRPVRPALLGAVGGVAATSVGVVAVLALTGGARPSEQAPDDAASRSAWTSAASAQAPSTSRASRDAAGEPTTYDAANMLDADAATAWRMDGDGTGAVLTFTLDAKRPLKALGLVNGYAKTDPATGADRYAQERRITRVTWLVDGREVPQALTDGVREAQVVEIEPVVASQVQLRIDATTGPGDPAFDKTAISDVALLG